VKRLTIPILLACVALMLLPAAASALSYDEAVDQLVADGYTVDIEEYLTSLGTDPLLGFRLAGSWAEHDASFYVRDELAAMGLSDVRLEPVPVDAWDFKGARVTVDDPEAEGGVREIVASSFAGVPGSGGEITAPLVYVGTGTRQEFDAAGDVTGKLVLCDIELDDIWLNFVGHEATLRGAAGVVMTYGENTWPWYAVNDEALGGNDGEYDDDWVSMVYVAKADGDWLKEQLAAGDVSATMWNDVEMTLAEDGGVGYNVVGVLPGSQPDLAPVLLCSHLDVHFRAGLDDTGAVANELLTARAMMESGVQPQRTVIFLFTCAEEYGYTDCWYDWAIGAWYAITEEHPEWAGELAFMLNIELMAESDAVFRLRAAADVAPFVEEVAEASGDVLPNGFEVEPTPSTWTDQWSFNASGVPTVTTSAGGPEWDTYYHTDFETKERVDHGYLGGIAKWNYRVLQGLDEGVLPYDLRARGTQLIKTIKPGRLVRAGVDRKAANEFKRAAERFRHAALKWNLRREKVPEWHVAEVNEMLIYLEKIVNESFTGRDSWDFTAYQHEQPVVDAIYLKQAIDAAKLGNTTKAMRAISWYVGINWYASLFSPEVCKADLARHALDYEHVTWGALGSPSLLPDCIDEYMYLEAGDCEAALPGLKADLTLVRDDLRQRVAETTETLEYLTAELQEL
jgi:Iap family predicted aminopeptidase